MRPHPVRIVIADELRRSRLTVFFRLLLAIPHFVWLYVWALVAYVVAVVAWLVTLILGRLPEPLHRFLAAYIRYYTHFNAFLYLAANPFPGFLGRAGSYPVDLEIDGPARQHRLVTGFRLLLAIPALIVLLPLTYLLYGIAFLGWFTALVLGRMPHGFRNALASASRYFAQVSAYLFLLTDRYPDSDPRLPASAGEPPPRPIRLTVDDDLRRSRLTVFFRLLLAIPHFVWLYIWTLVAYVVAVVGWLVTLILGRLPEPLHRFLAAFVRYYTHVYAFVFLVANPFPGFVGRAGSYPVDVQIDEPARQHRLVTGFRLLLAIPVMIVAGVLGFALYVVAFLGWFAALVTGRMPAGLAGLGAWALRYTAEQYAYLLFLTDRYPYSGPPVERPAATEEPEPGLEPLAAPGT